METKILIREAKSSDASMLFTIRNDPENYKWFHNDAPVSMEQHINWLNDRLSKARSLTLVAEIDGEVIGTAYLNHTELAPPKVSVSVKQGMKGIGVGSKLLRELISRCRNANMKTLFAEIRISNLASFHFFSHLGFVEARDNSKRATDSGDGILEMTLNLDSWLC